MILDYSPHRKLLSFNNSAGRSRGDQAVSQVLQPTSRTVLWILSHGVHVEGGPGNKGNQSVDAPF